MSDNPENHKEKEDTIVTVVEVEHTSIDNQTPQTHVITKSLKSPPDVVSDSEEASHLITEEEEEILSDDACMWSNPRVGMAQSVRVR